MPRTCLLPAFGLLLVLALPRTAAAGTVWLCGLAADLTRLVCVHDLDPAAEADLSAATTTAEVNGTRFPLDPRGRWTVDLWSPATEREPVVQLARATICYRSPGCEVIVSMPGSDAAAFAPIVNRRKR